jgi:hypothetical protein
MEWLKNAINVLSLPQWSFTLSLVGFVVAMRTRFLWTKKGGLVMLVVGGLFYVLAMLDPNFRSVVAKPDNVPITMMIFITGFFVWLAMHKAQKNDDLMERGEPTFEQSEVEDKIFTWPDLVFSEFICMVLLTVGMVVWSIALPAPLEEPANPSMAPNPSKAPWYFLGLQEMLVYFDPWMAGVVLPGLIIFGLMAIPYIDKNPKGNGYYTFKERRPEIVIFFFGFLILWIELIVIGTFLRGPNWNFFGPFEFWDVNKIEPLVNVDLSELVWIKALGVGLPGHWLIREAPGLILVLLYFIALPIGLARVKYFKHYYDKMGPSRYYIGITLFLTMMMMPIKMYFRWVFNLKYFVHIQEFFLNI